MSNLVLICTKSHNRPIVALVRTLRDSTDSDVHKLLHVMLTLERLRKRDTMAVEPIVRLTRPEVIEVLSKKSLAVHTLVPEKNRFWTSNHKRFVALLLPSARDLLAVFWPLITTLTPLALDCSG